MMRMMNRLIDLTLWLLWAVGILMMAAAFCQLVEPKLSGSGSHRRSRDAKLHHGASAPQRSRGQASRPDGRLASAAERAFPLPSRCDW